VPYRRILQLACFALCLITPALAAAAPRPWLSGSIGGSAYAMGDVNDQIGVINSNLAGTGLEMDEITKGLNYGLAFGLDVTPAFSVGLGYDRLTGQSDFDNGTESIEYDLPANLLRGFGRYSFQGTGKAKGFLEVSLGRVSSDASASATVVGVPPNDTKLEGSGLAAEGAGGFSYWTSPKIALMGSLGYRFAKAEDIEADGIPLQSPNGNGGFSIDYSGIFVRFGLTLAFAP
jgi:hypothetical protein